MGKGTCTSPECGREVFCRQLCYSHYRRLQRGGSVDTPIREVQGLESVMGLRLPKAHAKAIHAVAQAEEVSDYEQIKRIIDEWYRRTTGR